MDEKLMGDGGLMGRWGDEVDERLMGGMRG